jgi:hypothetical protein
VKHLFAMVVICTLLMVAGCSGNNNVGTNPSFPETTLGASGSGAGARLTTEAMQSDSSASGGTSLPAAAPYGGNGKGAVVQQNVNPMPFLTSSSPLKPGMTLPGSASALVSRADGTMYGPTDMSPAGSGPGMEGPGSEGATPNQSFRGAGTKSTAGATIPGNQSNKGAIPK